MLKFLPLSWRRGLGRRASGRPGRRPVLAGAAAVAASALMALTLMPAATAAAAPRVPAPAVPHLAWRACGGGLFCATASVPLDYAQPAGTKISIAVIKHPATDPARRIGSLFFNPGGPGDSGVTFLRQAYSLFPPAVRARFDVVSFDPRGIGQSTVLKCFASNQQEQQLLGPVASEGYPVGTAQQRVWENTYARFDKACAAHAGPLLAHDSTADVARDMDLLRRAVGDPTLNYYGISYGTYLGATYANLFPSKVRAMVLDGNANPVQWATGTGGSAAVLSTGLRLRSDQGSAAALNAFLELCGRAPASSCAFSAGTPAATRARFATLLNRLARHPVTMAGTTYTTAVAVDTVVNGLYQALPIPRLTGGWSDLATALEDLWTATSGGPVPATIPSPARDFTLAGSRGVRPDAGAPYSGAESALGVLCSDSPNPRIPVEYAAQAALASARSGVVGPDWVWSFEACAQWPVLARDRYTGPFNRPTAAPILVVGNTVDPATPYQDAVAMSRDLADARLLTVDGYGHTALANASSCAAAAEDRYFVTGALPRPGTVCHQNSLPFGG
ncbi:MAG TPA: alpha/beta hydrolase [Streptosporangiaceae bacterium]|nr:alpha/beta hydrolase [Streptosporangiaceae bacterium]